MNKIVIWDYKKSQMSFIHLLIQLQTEKKKMKQWKNCYHNIISHSAKLCCKDIAKSFDKQL